MYPALGQSLKHVPFLLCFAVTSVFAEEEDRWIPPEAESFQLEEKEQLVDGIPTAWVELSSPRIQLRWYPVGAWRLMQTAAPGASVSFFDRRRPALEMHLAYYPSGGMESLKRSELIRYINGLGEAFPKAGEIRFQNFESMRPPEGSIPFLSSRYRQLFFDIIPEDPSKTAVAFADVLTFPEAGGLLRLRFRGPPEAVAPLRSDMEAELGSFLEWVP